MISQWGLRWFSFLPTPLLSPTFNYRLWEGDEHWAPHLRSGGARSTLPFYIQLPPFRNHTCPLPSRSLFRNQTPSVAKSTYIKQRAGLHILQVCSMEQSASSRCYIACQVQTELKKLSFQTMTNIIDCHCGVSVNHAWRSQVSTCLKTLQLSESWCWRSVFVVVSA